MNMIWIIIAIFGFGIIALLISRRNSSTVGAAGTPPAGQATMADVERLIQANQLIAAIKCYRELHNCGLAEAKQAVEQIRDRIKPL